MTAPTHIDDFIARLRAALDALPREAIEDLVALLRGCAASAGTVFLMGNGGSAATCSHFASDLLASTAGSALRVIALVDSLPTVTAVANDYGYEHIFERPIRRQARPGDVVLALSGSGRSRNILRGLAAAREAGARTVALLGSGGGEALPLVDLPIALRSEDIKLVETVHGAIAHMVATALRADAATDAP